MPSPGLADIERSLLMVVDVQPTFLRVCSQPDQTLDRIKVLTQAAALLDVPVVATEQVPARMGGTEPELRAMFPQDTLPVGKSVFSAWGEPEVVAQVQGSGRTQVVLCGIETQICITQTAHDLMDAGFEVFLAADAITGRGEAEKQTSLQRLRHAGAIVSLVDSVLYEWLQTAEHPKFRAVLGLVKG